MKLTVDSRDFSVWHDGFEAVPDGATCLYRSPGSDLSSIAGLAQAEYVQAVEVDAAARTVAFGRDYLGHLPLFYCDTGRHLCVSDDVAWLTDELRAAGIEPTLCEEALALYFTMGYIPDAYTVFREIHTCESHSAYRWKSGRVTRESLFEAIEIDPSADPESVRAAIERDVEKWAAAADEIDVWCSGGLDSSIMASRFNAKGRRAELVTLAYGEDVHRTHGDGERGFAHEMARACSAPIRDVHLPPADFERVHDAFVSTHSMPVIDMCVPAKYALAGASRGFVITGEGSDPLFAGPKNHMMLHARERNPRLTLGWLYALAHNRFGQRVPEIFGRGRELSEFVVDYLQHAFDRYPGDLLRKLFYLNTHMKASSLIFTESYYASRARGLRIRHPYSALGVYRAAYRLEDRHKYQFPKDKLVLKALYADELPYNITHRRKAGTAMPLGLYVGALPQSKLGLEALENTGLFESRFLDEMRSAEHRRANPMLAYAFVTLNHWINLKGATRHANLPAATRRHEQPRAVPAL